MHYSNKILFIVVQGFDDLVFNLAGMYTDSVWQACTQTVSGRHVHRQCLPGMYTDSVWQACTQTVSGSSDLILLCHWWQLVSHWTIGQSVRSIGALGRGESHWVVTASVQYLDTCNGNRMHGEATFLYHALGVSQAIWLFSMRRGLDERSSSAPTAFLSKFPDYMNIFEFDCWNWLRVAMAIHDITFSARALICLRMLSLLWYRHL